MSYTYIADAAGLAQAIAACAGRSVLAVDTETTGLDPFTNRLLLVQIATPAHAYLIDARAVDLAPLAPLLEAPDVLKLAQNGKFDYKFLRQQADLSLRPVYDTYLAEIVLHAGLAKESSLERMAYTYADIRLDKSVRAGFIGHTGPFSTEQLAYAARDVLTLFTIYDQQVAQARRDRLTTIINLECKVAPVVGEIELAGCLVDETTWRSVINEHIAARDELAHALQREFTALLPQASTLNGAVVNLNSTAQIQQCFWFMHIPIPDTQEATLQKVSHPLAARLLDYRGHQKDISAFGDSLLALIHPHTGRIHPEFRQLGADTGRFSCSKPNMQQIPATSSFRSLFVAPPGYKMITCDYSQAELRILAELSGDEAFLHAFRTGEDLHRLTASQMYKVPLDQVTKDQRKAAKFINFGLAYGRGSVSLAAQIGVEPEEAKDLIAKYFAAYAGVKEWLEGAAQQAVRQGYSITLGGRKRYYPPLLSGGGEAYRKMAGDIERKGKNSPIQGGNVDWTKLALVYLDQALPAAARIVNTVHDEIVVEAPEAIAEDVAHIVEREMVRAGEFYLTRVPVVAEATIADCWSK